MGKIMHCTVTLAAFVVVLAVPTHSNPFSQHGHEVTDTRIVNVPGISDQRFPQGNPVPRPVAVSHPNFQRPGQPTVTARPKPQRQPATSAAFPTTTTTTTTTTTRRTPLSTTTTTTAGTSHDPSRPVTQRPGTLLSPVGAGVNPQIPPANRDRHCGTFPSPGECQAAFPRYYYNSQTSQCDCYLFGGCDEDVGSYKTLEECHSRCQPDLKDEGPSCKFVFIDNFSPLMPSTTTTSSPSTTPSHSVSTAPAASTGNRRPPIGNRPSPAGVPSDPTKPGGSLANNRRSPSSSGSVSFPQPLDVRGVAFPKSQLTLSGPARPFHPRTVVESPDYERDDDYS